MDDNNYQTTMEKPHLSLVAQFDDIVRNTSVLTQGIEAEFWRFVNSQETFRKQWLDALHEVKDMKKRVKILTNDNAALETKLKHARNQIDHEIKKRMKAESDRDSYDRQIALVRELLTDKNNQTLLNQNDREKLAFLNSFQPSHTTGSPRKNLSVIEESMSLLSDGDISYDKTEEELDVSYLRNGRVYSKRPSAPPEDEDTPPPDKKKTRTERRSRRSSRKHRRSRSAVVATTTISMQNGEIETASEITTGKSPLRKFMKKHYSDKDIRTLNKENAGDSDDSMGYNRSPKHGIYITPPNEGSPKMRHYNSGSKGLKRAHVFKTNKVLMPEICNPCGKRIRFGKSALKCKECRVSAHPECKDLVPLPCIPSLTTPGTVKMAGGILADYAPTDPPMIPALVIHCVNEIEARGLNETGIYRIPGSDKEVKDLKERFLKGRGTPNLSHINDIHVVCGCLKDFLRNLKEPIVTFALWPQFLKAAELSDRDESESAMYQAISQLPQPNRDTLAFMILHLQRVAESLESKMTMTNLCKVFGPTLVGFSSIDTEPLQIMSETGKQPKIVERLMMISADYWTNFINVEPDVMIPMENMTPQTPEMRPVPHSMLGPISTPTDSTESDSTKGWFNTPRFATKSRQVTKKPTHFFSSPTIR